MLPPTRSFPAGFVLPRGQKDRFEVWILDPDGTHYGCAGVFKDQWTAAAVMDIKLLGKAQVDPSDFGAKH